MELRDLIKKHVRQYLMKIYMNFSSGNNGNSDVSKGKYF